MMTVRFIILLIAIHWVKPESRPNRSLWLDGHWQPRSNNYEEVPLLHPRFKSKNLMAHDWYHQQSAESGGNPQKRHLEWFDGSDEDTQSADASENGLITGILGSNDDSSKEEESAEDKKRHHHRKKYVKVNKMLLPLLLAYKLKFFTMIPVLIGALTLLVSTTGLAGFFFALFAAAAGLHAKGGGHH